METDYSEVTHLQLRLAAGYFKRITGSYRAEAELQVAQMLCEQTGKQYPKEIDETLRVIGSFMPTKLSETTAQEVRKIIEFCIDSFPVEAFDTKVQSQGVLQTVTVETADSKEKHEKWLKVQGIRFPRNPDKPHSALYPHPWIMMRATETSQVVVEAWNRQVTSIFIGVNIEGFNLPRYRRYLEVAESLIELLDQHTVPETIPKSWLKIWMANAELLSELLALSQCPRGFVQLTTFFHAKIQTMKNLSEMDYSKAIQDTLVERDKLAPKPFAKNQRGR